MAMKTCKDCGQEISSSAKKCPHCGKNQKNTFLKIIIYIVISIVIIFIGFFAISKMLVKTVNDFSNSIDGFGNSVNDFVNDASNAIDNYVESTKDNFTVLDEKVVKDSYLTYITGTIQNNTDKEYSYVQIEINLYDKDGALINSTLDNINNLEANGKWKFKAMATSEFATYKIKEITGF